MPKIKTSALTGPALDWAVEEARGYGKRYLEFWNIGGDKRFIYCLVGNSPSTQWSQGGPIKERERIATRYSKGKWYAMRSEDLGDGERAQWCKYTFRGVPKSASTSRQCRFSAEAELVAVMRCYVASKLGDEVDVPEELLT